LEKKERKKHAKPKNKRRKKQKQMWGKTKQKGKNKKERKTKHKKQKQMKKKTCGESYSTFPVCFRILVNSVFFLNKLLDIFFSVLIFKI
jgi:hypothetical protein